MIRLTVLTVAMLALMAYAWKDWYKSLCGLMVLTSVLNHPDVPRSLLGVQGLSPFNILLLNNLAAWVVSRGRERLRFNLPIHLALLLFAYFLVIVVGFTRLLADRTNMEAVPAGKLWVDSLVNPVKWLIPGLLFFDGARTTARLRWGLFSSLLIYLFLALMVIKAMPLGAIASGSQLEHTALKLIQTQMNYSRVNMSMMLGGGAWAILAARTQLRTWWWRALVLAAFLLTTYGQSLTGGRTGYVTWAVIGIVLGLLRWRRMLLLGPVVVIVVALAVPAATERLFTGIKDADAQGALVPEGEESVDYDAVTSGRSWIWPRVIEKIGEAPWFGYGTQAMYRVGLAVEFPEFPHPHNAYLEILLDGGWISLVPVVLFYLAVLMRAMWLFLKPRGPVDEALGGAALALTLALLVAGVGSQHFYPQMGSIGMWAVIGLMLRASVDRSAMRRSRGRRGSRRPEGSEGQLVFAPLDATS